MMATDSEELWYTIIERAVVILRSGEIEHEIDPIDLEGDVGQHLMAGIAIGVSAALRYFVENPDCWPPTPPGS